MSHVIAPEVTIDSTPLLLELCSDDFELESVELKLPDLESAVAYAEFNDIDYVVQQPKSRRVKPRAYADNFAFTRNGAWTH